MTKTIIYMIELYNKYSNFGGIKLIFYISIFLLSCIYNVTSEITLSSAGFLGTMNYHDINNRGIIIATHSHVQGGETEIFHQIRKINDKVLKLNRGLGINATFPIKNDILFELGVGYFKKSIDLITDYIADDMIFSINFRQLEITPALSLNIKIYNSICIQPSIGLSHIINLPTENKIHKDNFFSYITKQSYYKKINIAPFAKVAVRYEINKYFFFVGCRVSYDYLFSSIEEEEDRIDGRFPTYFGLFGIGIKFKSN